MSARCGHCGGTRIIDETCRSCGAPAGNASVSMPSAMTDAKTVGSLGRWALGLGAVSTCLACAVGIGLYSFWRGTDDEAAISAAQNAYQCQLRSEVDNLNAHIRSLEKARSEVFMLHGVIATERERRTRTMDIGIKQAKTLRNSFLVRQAPHS